MVLELLDILIRVAKDLHLDVDTVSQLLLSWARMQAAFFTQPFELLPANKLVGILHGLREALLIFECLIDTLSYDLLKPLNPGLLCADLHLIDVDCWRYLHLMVAILPHQRNSPLALRYQIDLGLIREVDFIPRTVHVTVLGLFNNGSLGLREVAFPTVEIKEIHVTVLLQPSGPDSL